jgi:hypothetical protein
MQERKGGTMAEVVMVTGSRHWKDENAIRHMLDQYDRPGNVLIQGGAKGADTLAYEYWTKHLQLPSITVPAPWKRAARAAGPMRNRTMVIGNSLAPHAVIVPTVVVAYPIEGGRGTQNAMKYAYEAEIGVQIWDPDCQDC